MNTPGKGSYRPNPQEQAKVPYSQIRDRFLTSYNDTDDVEWLIEVGRYVQDRWMAEELSRTVGQPWDVLAPIARINPPR